MKLLSGYDVDALLGWPMGRTQRLAKLGKLPFVRLPNGDLRFDLDEIQKLILHVTPTGAPVASTKPPAAAGAVASGA